MIYKAPLDKTDPVTMGEVRGDQLPQERRAILVADITKKLAIQTVGNPVRKVHDREIGASAKYRLESFQLGREFFFSTFAK